MRVSSARPCARQAMGGTAGGEAGGQRGERRGGVEGVALGEAELAGRVGRDAWKRIPERREDGEWRRPGSRSARGPCEGGEGIVARNSKEGGIRTP